MVDDNTSQITLLLNAAQQGDADAASDLMPLLYEDLRRLASSQMAGLAGGQTLQATALVHEAYLRLVDKHAVTWDGRRHFFFAAARAMRDILIEQARSKAGPTRGGKRRRESLDDITITAGESFTALDVLAVHEALTELELRDPVKAKLVLLRYFSGLTVAEAAEVMNESERTLHRHWRVARAWLQDRLADDPTAGRLDADTDGA